MIVWDENDYSGTPNAQHGLFPSQNQNQVVLTVQTNHGRAGVKSGNYYNSFSLLKSILRASVLVVFARSSSDNLRSVRIVSRIGFSRSLRRFAIVVRIVRRAQC